MRRAFLSVVLLSILTLGNALAGVPEKIKHPKHELKVWTTTFRAKKRQQIYRVISLPRCEHIEVIPTFLPFGETKKQAKKRLNGVAVCTSCYFDPTNFRAVDFFRKNGVLIIGCEVGRSFLAISPDGSLEISRDYEWLKGKTEVNAVALGQSLEPFRYEGFSLDFSQKITDRMALGLTKNNIFIVQGCCDLPTLSRFMTKVLHCQNAINADGGHVVKGLSPYHLVFRWKLDRKKN